MAELIKILHLEDNDNDAELVLRALRKAGFHFHIERVSERDSFVDKLSSFKPDIVLSDYEVSGFDGVAALNLVCTQSPGVPVLIVTGVLGDETAVEMLKSGAKDYVLKDRLARLGPAVTRALADAAADRQRQMLEQARHENEMRFRALIENTSDIVSVINSKGIISYISPAITPVAGYAEDEVIGRNFLDFIHPEDRQVALATLAQILRERHNIVPSEFRYRDKAGSWLVFEGLSKNLLYTPAINGIVVNLRDVTQRREMEHALAQSEEQMRLLLDSTAEGLYGLDTNGVCTFANRACVAMLGYDSADELVGRQLHAMMHHTRPDGTPYPRKECKIYRAFQREEHVHVVDELYWRRDGSSFPVEYWAYPVNQDGTVRGAVVTFMDITEKRSQEASIERLHRIRAVLSAINSAIMHVRSQEELLQRACEIAVQEGKFRMAWVGLLQDGKSIIPVAVASAEPSFLEQAGPLMDPDESIDETPAATALRTRKPFLVHDLEALSKYEDWHKTVLSCGFRSMGSFPLIVNDTPTGVLNLFSSETETFAHAGEISLLKELARDISFGMGNISQSQQLNYLAYYDPVTRLANRRLFIERLDQLVQAARQVNGEIALLMLDLDRFKSVNDTFGMAVGDELLKQVAERLVEIAGRAELVARVGSNRFVVVVQELVAVMDFSEYLQQRFWKSLDQVYVLSSGDLGISVKFGIALFPSSGDEAESLFQNAEAALKHAKAQNERYMFHAKHMTIALKERFALERNINRALASDEFLPFYQPKVDLRTGNICGAEALLRWSSPELGIVPPASFVPLLEETGQIIEVGQRILKMVVADRRRWLEVGLPAPRVAVNVSPVQLRNADFVRLVHSEIASPTDRAPGVDLEVTESMLMIDIESNIEKLTALRDYGIKISIDDFGTGYSSLAYLARLPVDTVKIDRSFIIKMTESADTMTIVSTIIALAHSLNMRVVAEGVETQEQLKFLRLLKCDEIQGYLFSKPLPAEEFAALLKEGRQLA